MPKPELFVRVPLSISDYATASIESGRACKANGRSHVRGVNEREATRSTDNLVGMLGQAALSKYLTGSIWRFQQDRYRQNSNPRIGDGGEDFSGLAIDVKTTFIRAGRAPEDHFLAVHDRELRPGWLYFQALVDMPEGRVPEHPVSEVLLCGWATSDVLTRHGDRGQFHNTAAIRIRNLYPIPPFLWFPAYQGQN